MSKEVQQWEVPVSVTRHVTVTVEAKTSAEATAKAEGREWVHESMGETVDWDAIGSPTAV